MFEKAQTTLEQVPTQVHEQRIVLFDFHQHAFASPSFSAPSLIIDRQPLNDRGMPGISSETRANHIGERAQLGIPPVENIGKVYLEEEDESAYVLAVRKPIHFRNFILKPYDLDDVVQIAHAEANRGHETAMNTVDAKLILASLALDKVRNRFTTHYRLG